MIVETYGGVAPHSLAHIGYLHKRATGDGGYDRTEYGTTRISTASFFKHHTQRLSKAAVTWDAAAIRKQEHQRGEEAAVWGDGRGGRERGAGVSPPSRRRV